MPKENKIYELLNFVTFVEMNNNKNNYFLLKKPIALAVLMLLFSFTVIHRYYFSLTEIRVDSQKQTLSVSCKMFTDDLETSLDKLYQKKVNLTNSTQNKEVQALLFKYIKEHFSLTVNNEQMQLSFIGYENEDDATWCYLEMQKFDKKGKIKVVNNLLFDFLPDQTNIIQFYWDQINKTEKLSNPDKEAVFEF